LYISALHLRIKPAKLENFGVNNRHKTCGVYLFISKVYAIKESTSNHPEHQICLQWYGPIFYWLNTGWYRLPDSKYGVGQIRMGDDHRSDAAWR
jgi:hypothetical protein